MTAESVLGMCLEKDGRQLSATDTREADWSDADRLDVLEPQWSELRNMAAQRRYEAALHAALSERDAGEVLADPAAGWVWRALREAEAAGLDGPATLHRAVTAGRLDDAESIAKVLHWRIGQRTAGMPARAARPWAGLVGTTGDPDADRYWAQLAETMEDRQRRLGEHTAEHPPPWAQALGPVPEHPVDRADWEHKAATVAAYREMWGHAHPHEPIGPRPAPHADPHEHAMWQAAAEALGRQPGDMAEHSDGQLHAWRHHFTREMQWAPEYKGDELALVRGEIRRAQIDADRARRNAEAADTPDARQRLEQLAGLQATWERTVRDVAGRLGQAQAGYDAWEAATAPTRDRAVAADAELRRRHADIRLEPLHGHAQPSPATPEPRGAGNTGPRQPAHAGPAAEARPDGPAALIPVTDAEVAAASAQPRQHPAPDPAQAAKWRAEQAARIQADRQARAEAAARACPVTDAEIAKYGPGQQDPAPQPEPGTTGLASHQAKMEQIHQQVQEISARLDEVAMARARQAQEKAAEVTTMSVPDQDPDAAPSAAWIDAVQARQRQAVRQEPMPRVPAAEAIQATTEATADAGIGGPEAAD